MAPSTGAYRLLCVNKANSLLGVLTTVKCFSFAEMSSTVIVSSFNAELLTAVYLKKSGVM
jgi:hypothetical protein